MGGAVAFFRRPPQLWYYKNGTYMACNAGSKWLTYSLCAALYGLYAGYVWPSVTIFGLTKIGNVMPYFTMLRLNQLPCTEVMRRAKMKRLFSCELPASCSGS